MSKAAKWQRDLARWKAQGPGRQRTARKAIDFLALYGGMGMDKGLFYQPWGRKSYLPAIASLTGRTPSEPEMRGLYGKRPSVLILDELTALDFLGIEERALAHQGQCLREAWDRMALEIIKGGKP